ncbi:MAG: prepilin-type N-terminal cleavage/methylation domain-containing protein [Candidatus Colwellbacteria bacterium]|nr:prepilin-type N-terminal cleavage/methylation domain-containing protein [Candidatus Colwellbacteria bacterium]MDD3752853.1 prepilin-type N-terminal cleavage/methylation domain-containing protein [Candidatus Colwellbacteria bacterium]
MFGVFDKVNLKSFTLVELLIVIAILAVLAAAVVIVLNPAELLSQARDGQRSSDIKMMGDALTLFVTDNPSLSIGTYKKVYISIPDSSVDCSGISNLPDFFLD